MDYTGEASKMKTYETYEKAALQQSKNHPQYPVKEDVPSFDWRWWIVIGTLVVLDFVF